MQERGFVKVDFQKPGECNV